MGEQQADQPNHQPAFDFASNSTDGLSLWREQRYASIRRLGAELGYPLGEQCEVELQSGVILRGKLILDGEDLFLLAERSVAILRIGKANFSIGEVASCVRTDWVMRRMAHLVGFSNKKSGKSTRTISENEPLSSAQFQSKRVPLRVFLPITNQQSN